MIRSEAPALTECHWLWVVPQSRRSTSEAMRAVGHDSYMHAIRTVIEKIEVTYLGWSSFGDTISDEVLEYQWFKPSHSCGRAGTRRSAEEMTSSDSGYLQCKGDDALHCYLEQMHRPARPSIHLLIRFKGNWQDWLHLDWEIVPITGSPTKSFSNCPLSGEGVEGKNVLKGLSLTRWRIIPWVVKVRMSWQKIARSLCHQLRNQLADCWESQHWWPALCSLRRGSWAARYAGLMSLMSLGCDNDIMNIFEFLFGLKSWIWYQIKNVLK